MAEFAALYYPFSRCMNAASLKQLLLVFDQISFVDPVDDDQWRTKLFKDLETHDKQFSQYQDIHPALPELLDHGCVRRIDPAKFSHKNRMLAVESALSDLRDSRWLNLASNPRKYRMPSIDINGCCSWQIFRPKLPQRFLDVLATDPAFRSHLLEEGDDWSSWSLSYAAGSAIGIGLHLEIAEELGIAPVTDSELHHKLLLLKIGRSLESTDQTMPIPDDAIRHLMVNIASTMLAEVLPEDRLREITFEEIILFRHNTNVLRKQFISDIEARLGQLRTIPTPQEWIVAGRQVLSSLQTELRNYQAEFTSHRDKIWPRMASTLNSVFVSGSLGAVAMSYIGGPGKALLGSIGGASIAVLQTSLDWRAESRKLLNSSAPSISYLSRVANNVK